MQFDEKVEENETSEEINKQRDERYSTIEVVYISLGKSWPKNKQTQLQYQDILLNECYKALEQSPRDIQVSILTALHCYIDKLHYFSSDVKTTEEEERHLSPILVKMCDALHYSLGEA